MRKHLLSCLAAIPLALVFGGVSLGSVISGNATNASGSTPRLNAAGDDWEPFNVAQGVPSASKPGITVRFIADDGDPSGFPLNAAAGAVTLRPATAGAPVACTFDAAVPALTPSNAGTCTFRILPGGLGDTVQIFYLGLLGNGEDIKYTINGLAPAVGGHTIQPFDSDTVLAGNPPSPTLARLPARLVVVFDKSGSMKWSAKPADPACGPVFSPILQCQRWDILKKAAAQFVNVAKAYALPGDELGVAFFDTAATDTGGIAAMTSVTLNAVNTALGGTGPGGGTSIGAGVERLQAGLTGGDTADFNNMTLLFTDGEQNTAPFLVSDGTSLLINATQNQPFGDPWSDPPAQVGLCAFRLRPDDPAGPGGTTTLQQIADIGCDGLMNSAASLDALPQDLIQFFLEVLNQTLIGDKLELLVVSQGQGTTGTAISQQFVTSQADGAFSMLINWEQTEGMRGMSEIELSKDGVTFFPLQDPAFLVDRGPDHLVITLRAPFCGAGGDCVSPAGAWTLNMLPTGGEDVAFNYGLIVVSDNATLASKFSVSQAQKGVGQPLALRAELTEGGQPLTGLAANTVQAFVSGPGAGLGNVLSASQAKPGGGTEADAVSPAGQKALAMLADPAEQANLLAALAFGGEQGIPLVETDPGVYEAPFAATDNEGVYRVSFRAAANAPGNGDFTRIFNTDHYVPVAPDPQSTNATLSIVEFTGTCNQPAGCKAIKLTPKDAKENLLGPGKTAIFTTAQFDGELIGVQDNLDGSYTIQIGYKDRAAMPPTLQVGEFPVPLPESAGPERGVLGGIAEIIKRWWILLLLILFLLLFLAYFIRKKTA